ncbi:twin-arginine translocation pathway signal protein [Ramlibacter henchirensis]|uniref:Twin-arginine translocation pathway signal protein n=1 Tax=Ramlibacter henchirensis TaxID=204072 RepID=A0A4Z0BXC3_9BURK|nr:Bug family tripartite tricarboxylate transporter substrate binding protein [Ramlibacter henchirensis]TFZ02655.1 twin-arginine translocation pathway signal protein [Ramlibacter henchirensis]
MIRFAPGVSRRHLLCAAAALAAAAPFHSLAQARKLATITTGFATGGSLDVTARVLADHLRGKYAESVIVENKAGASGRLAVEHVKSGAGDGSNLLVSPSGMMVLFPHIYRSLRYDPLNDFTPVTPLAKFPFVFAISPLVPSNVRTLSDFIAWCKANPKQASFGSPGAGTSAHFSGIMLGRRANMEFAHAAYRGMAPLVQDLLGGQIASGVLTPADALPLMSSGKLRLLATTGTTRSRFTPDVPTYTEAGFPEIVIEESYSLYAPAAVSQDTVVQLAALAHEMLARPETQARLAQMGLEAAPQQPAQFKAALKALHDRWGGIVKTSGFTPQD